MLEPKPPDSPGGKSSRGSHRLAEISRCPRKWYFQNVLELEPKRPAIYYVEGTLIHLALAYHHASRMAVKPQWFLETTLDAALAREGRGWPQAIELAKDVGEAYARRYAEDPWQPLAIEHEFSASVGEIRRLTQPFAPAQPDDDERVSARIDLFLRSGGYLWAADYKSTAHASSRGLTPLNPEGEYAVHWQFLLQTAIMRVNFGAEFRGVLVERVSKKAPHDFDRAVAPISQAMFNGLADVVARQCRAERELVSEVASSGVLGASAGPSAGSSSEWLPVGNPWSCFSWGHPCEFRQLCTSETFGQRQSTLVRDYQCSRRNAESPRESSQAQVEKEPNS
jgi:hypothetical protein